MYVKIAVLSFLYNGFIEPAKKVLKVKGKLPRVKVKRFCPSDFDSNFRREKVTKFLAGK